MCACVCVVSQMSTVYDTCGYYVCMFESYMNTVLLESNMNTYEYRLNCTYSMWTWILKKFESYVDLKTTKIICVHLRLSSLSAYRKSTIHICFTCLTSLQQDPTMILLFCLLMLLVHCLQILMYSRNLTRCRTSGCATSDCAAVYDFQHLNNKQHVQ